MFPKILDGANVIYYTLKSDYGTILYSNGEIADYIKFLAICKYPNEKDEYYLFKCNEKYEVIGDSMYSSIKECIESSKSSYSDKIIWNKVI